jgi:hypothetical protein
MKVTVSPSCSIESKAPLSSQSQSLTSTRIPGRLLGIWWQWVLVNNVQDALGCTLQLGCR